MIGRTLGVGSFGKVKAAWLADGSRYVLKVLKHEGEFLKKRRAFRQEIEKV